MSTPHPNDRLWDPESGAETPGEHDELLARLELRLVPLKAPTAPELELPAQVPASDPSPAQVEATSRSRSWIVALVSLAAALALWLAWRAQPPPPSSATIAQRSLDGSAQTPRGPDADVWRVEALEGDNHCRPPDQAPAEGAGPVEDLDEGTLLEDGAILELGADASARLSSGEAQLELRPHSRLRNDGGVLTLVEGGAWVDLPARTWDGDRGWQLGAGPLTLETPSARFMIRAQPGADIEIEIVTGTLTLAGGGEVAHARAGQLCRARPEPGPLAAMRSLECRP